MSKDSHSQVVSLLTKGASPERVGLFEHFWTETTWAWIDQGYPASPAEESDTAQQADSKLRTVSHVFPSFVGKGENLVPQDPYKLFEYDMFPCGGTFDTDPLLGYEEILEETDECILVKNGAGSVHRYWKHKSGTPEHVDFHMTSREIWETEYRTHLLTPNPERLNTGSLRSAPLEADKAALQWGQQAGKWCHFGHIFIWEIMRQNMGDLCMYESLALDPGWIKDFNRVYTDFFKDHFQLVFDCVGMPDGVWLYEDLGYRNGLFASPKMLRDLFLPFYAELVDYFHQLGLPVVLHSCGNITQAIPLFIEAGFDALQPMEVKAGCDPFSIAEQFGDQLALIGGLDVRCLESNDKKTVQREVTRLIEGMKAREARYIFHSDHSITPLVHYDTYRYALETYHECKEY